MRAARYLRLSVLWNTDSNLIFLGSPRTHLWTALFNDQLDFKINDDEQILPNRKLSRIFIRKPASLRNTFPPQKVLGLSTPSHDQPDQGPNHHGDIFFPAGASAEGTKAAGKWVTDIQAFSPTRSVAR